MPNPNVIVSHRVRLDPPLERPAAEMLRLERGLSVELDDQQRLRLDPDDPRSAGLGLVLDGLRRSRQPVYLEFDPQSRFVRRLLLPYVARVATLKPIDERRLEVQLMPSSARLILHLDSEDGREMEGRLRQALPDHRPLLVTNDDRLGIVDVRPFREDPEGPLPPPWPPEPIPPWSWRWLKNLLDRIWLWRCWPWWWFRCLSVVHAQQVFDAMSATSCDPQTVPPPCIPFLYPDDGCWGRAHEMCRLMIAMGLSPRKVWIQGQLTVATRNNPQCSVMWGWHVAPTLCMRRIWFLWSSEIVVDPSLFTTPVSKAGWKAVQGDPTATLTDSSASIFYLWSGETDPTYVKTNQVLDTYRLKLQVRSLQDGPPPYANCP